MDMQNLLNELINCRNELCLKCGAYRNSHNGACDGCRYNVENMKKWETVQQEINKMEKIRLSSIYGEMGGNDNG